MVKQNAVLTKAAKLLDASRRSGVNVIYVSVKFRAGVTFIDGVGPERSTDEAREEAA